MIVIEQIMAVCLAAANAPGYIPVFLIGYFLIDATLFGRALCALSFSMVYSRFLKDIFVILIPSSSGPGYVFPSGHMCAAVIFYGWLLISVINNKYLRVFLVVLLLGIGCSLVYYGYHIWIDIGGGIFFGTLFVLFMSLVIHKLQIFEEYPYLIGYFLLVFVILMVIVNHFFLAKVTVHQLLGMYILIGFPAFWAFYDTLVTAIVVHKTISNMHAVMV